MFLQINILLLQSKRLKPSSHWSSLEMNTISAISMILTTINKFVQSRQVKGEEVEAL